jgi:6-phosphogluconolactonase
MAKGAMVTAALWLCVVGATNARTNAWGRHVGDLNENQTMTMLVGTYTTPEKSQGIYTLTFDSATGTLSEPTLAVETRNPTFLALHPTKRVVYAVGEIGEYEGKPAGMISAFAIEPDGKRLRLLNRQSTRGSGPCHVCVDREGRVVLAANYGGGSTVILGLNSDGSLKPSNEHGFIQHRGKSVNPRRQEGPHAHSVNLDEANRFAIVADLGLDKLLVYKVDTREATITPNDPPAIDLPPGSGPRHFTFHPTRPLAYSVNELDSTVTTLAWDASTGRLTILGHASTLPEGFDAASVNNTTAEIVVHPSGRFLYASNRGHNSIAVFSLDPESGLPTLRGHGREGVETPRNFVIDPTGRYLLVGSQTADRIVTFAIDPQTGDLTPHGQPVSVFAPVCLRFVTHKAE